MKNYKLLCIAAAFAPMLSCAQVHKEQTLRDGWTFSFNGGEFKEVVLPHDWAISGEFDEGIDTYTTKEVRNGKQAHPAPAGIRMAGGLQRSLLSGRIPAGK